MQDGVVLETGSDGGRGNFLELYSPATRRTYAYFHLAAPATVRPGRRVRAGRRVGAVGCSGSCWGPHLHFEVRRGKGGRAPAIDPMPLLRRWKQSGT